MNSHQLLRITLAFVLAVGPMPKPVSAAQQAPAQPRDLELDVDNPVVAKPPGAGVPRGYALVVGISHYKNLDSSRQLEYPEADAKLIYDRLISKEGGAFPAENVKRLIGPDATLENIRSALEVWLPSVAKPNDRVLVFFAGHGFTLKDGRGFFAPWDVDLGNLEGTAYPMAKLGQVLADKVKAKWKVLFADACHSGKINPDTTNERLDAEFKDLPRDFLTFTASTEREQSYEDSNLAGGAGLFSYFLTQAWKGEADNEPCNGVITASELIEYVRKHVRDYARNLGRSQTPTARGDYEPSMLLGVSTSCGTSTPRTRGTAFVEVNLDNVDLYIDDSLFGKVSRSKPLSVPGLMNGLRVFKACKEGYQCETKRVIIAPGQDVTVTFRIVYVLKNKVSAIELNQQGERLLYSQRSSRDLRIVLPVSRSQAEKNLRASASLFERAVADDSTYAKAFFNLGQARQLLDDQPGSLTAYRSALAIDPSYVDARIQQAAILIESGDPDEAIRVLSDTDRIKESNDELHAMLARAFLDKGAWVNVVDSADQALRLNASNAFAHLWRADALRHMAAEPKTPAAEKPALYRDARDGYNAFISLTNFSSSVGERLAFTFIGMGIGSRKHADRDAAFRSLRVTGYLGLCLTEQKVGYLLRAREYCQRAVRYDDEFPISYFLLANVNRDLYNEHPDCEYLNAAASAYTRMLKLNPNLAESDNAKDYLGQIQGLVKERQCSGKGSNRNLA